MIVLVETRSIILYLWKEDSNEATIRHNSSRGRISGEELTKNVGRGQN